jgi:hypothetical protein
VCGRVDELYMMYNNECTRRISTSKDSAIDMAVNTITTPLTVI